jgi:hypothetical protein
MREYSADAFIPRDESNRSLRSMEVTPLVEVGEAGWMRSTRMAPVIIRPARYDGSSNRIEFAERMELEFHFIPDGSTTGYNPDPERYSSLDFEALTSSLLLNPGEARYILPGGRPIVRGSYLIITDSTIARFATTFAEWKRAKGFDVVVAPIYRDGIQADEVKAFIQDAYDNWDRPPEYVLLLGDVNDPNIQLPSFDIVNPDPRAPGEHDVTDLPYTLLAGDDYFPDLFLGRISVSPGSPSGVMTALARYTRHERESHTFPVGQFGRAVLTAGNFGDGAPVFSPVETSEWLGNELEERGYRVFTQFYRRPGDELSPDPIVEAINRGVNIVSYRGWADANGSHYPQFYRNNLAQLRNGPLLPVFTYFVCNTGNFGDEHVNPCFGEAAILQGNADYPTAALAFLGPSDLHTNTRFNNAMLAGYYRAFMDEQLGTFGSLTLRGKLELYKANPMFREMGGNDYFVYFYFSVYNLLGDPEVNLYFRSPTRLRVDLPRTLTVGDTRARVAVTDTSGHPIPGALVVLRKGNETNISVQTDREGLALIPVNLVTTDTIRVTVVGYQCSAFQGKIPVVAPADFLSVSGVVVRNSLGDNRLLTDIPVEITPTLRNLGNSARSGVTASLSCNIPGVEILAAEGSYGDIVAGGSAQPQAPFRIQLAAGVGDGASLPFELTIRDASRNTWTGLFRLNVVNGALAYRAYRFEGGAIQPGSERNLIVTVANNGSVPLTAVRGRLESFDGSVEIIDGDALFGDVATGASVDCGGNPFRIAVRNGTYIGRQVAMRMLLTNDDGEALGRQIFNVVVGEPDRFDPVGPDSRGYYAYDNTDSEYDAAPDYQWIELDGNFGGNGATRHELADDSTFTINLPFAFRYYGHDYRVVSICSNGWISFDNTQVWDFNNWPIPSPLGPHAMVCPYWEDLVGPDIGNGNRGPIVVLNRYDENEHRLVIQWSRAIARAGGDLPRIQNFEVILYDPAVRQTPTGDGEMLFQYEQSSLEDRGREQNYATVGIQNWDHFAGLQLTYAATYDPGCDSLRGGRAILITTVPPDEFLKARLPETLLPVKFAVGQPYPNPFNNRTSIWFDLPKGDEVRTLVFDLNGRLMQVIDQKRYEAGRHYLEIDSGSLPSGLYILRIEASGLVGQRKLTLLK